MNRDKNNLLTSNQMISTLIAYTVGIGILSLPDSLVKYAHQDAWISALLGSLYIIYQAILAIYMSNNHPTENILTLSKKHCGKLIGNILNLGFLIIFVIYTIVTTASFTNFGRVYMVPNVSPIKVICAFLLIAAYTAYKDIKVLGRINELSFFILVLIILTSSVSFRKGSIQNLLPIFQSGVPNIIKNAKDSMFSYAGIEAVFLIYPFIDDNKKIKDSIFTFLIIVTVLYTYVTFITLYYLGPDIVSKSMWSFTLVIESFILPIVNNFRFVFAFIWVGIALRSTANCYYASVFILRDLLGRGSRKRLFILTYPLMVFLASMLTTETIKRNFIDLVIPKCTIFIIIYISLITLLIFFKRNKRKCISPSH